jgi:tetratricopeptide (TPR) repeat protein
MTRRTTAASKAVFLALLALAGPLTPAGAQAPAAPPSPDSGSELPARIERVVVRDAVEADGSTSRVTEARVSLRNSAGVAQFGQLAQPYIADHAEVTFEDIAIEKPDGTRIEVKNPATEDINPYGMAGVTVPADFRVKSVTIPGLSAGDVLNYRIVVRGKPLFRDVLFDEFKFVVGPIAAEQLYELDMPAKLALSIRRRPSLPADWEERPSPPGRRLRRLTLRAPLPIPDPKAYEAEILTEPDVIFTTFRSWEDMGSWWWALAKARFVPDDAIRAEARRLVAGKADPRARAEALHAFVATQIRYVNVGFGSGRFQPSPAAEVLLNRYAECKGKHALLAALGAAVDLDIVPALVHSMRKALHPEVPSLTQFDHVVSVVRLGPDPSQWLWMDTTLDTALPGYLLPNLRGKSVLLVDGRGGRVVQTPDRPAFPSRVEVETRGTIDAAGPIRAHVRWTMRDDAEPMLRAGVRTLPREKLPELARKLAEEWTKGTVSDVTTADPADLGQPFWIDYAVEHKMTSRAFVKDWTLWVPLPEMELPKPSEGDAITTLSDYDEIRHRARIEMPEGMKARPPLSVGLDRPFASFRSTYAVEGRTLVIERVLKIRERKIPAAQKAEYEAFRNAVRTDRSQEFPIEALATAAAPSLDTADALNSAGVKALDEGDYERAEALLKQATEKDPNHKWAWNNMGRVLRKRKRPQEALKAFDRQIAINAFDVYSYGNRGAALLFDLGRKEEAEKDLLKQIEVAPFDPSGYVDLAYLRTIQDRFKEAAELLERAVAAKPDRHENWLKLGFARARAGTGDVAGAVARFRGGKPTPRDELRAARALALSGDVAEAARMVEEIQSRVFSTITADSAEALKESGVSSRHGGALYVAEAWRIAGAAALARGETEKAERFLAAAWDLGTLPEAAVDLGRLREKQGRTQEAIVLWQRASFLHAFRGNPARRELERVVKDPARLAALVKDAPQQLARLQVQALEGPPPAATVEVHVRLLADENGRVLDVVPDVAGDAAKLAPFRGRVIGRTLPGKSPDGVALKVVRPATLSCFATAGCNLGLAPLGEAVAWELEN